MGFTVNGVAVPAASGAAFSEVIGYEGASEGTATAARFKIALPNQFDRYNLPAGNTVLTLPILRAGVLTAVNPSSTTVDLPTLATLGYTDPGTGAGQLIIYYQRVGLGLLYINPAAGVKIVWNDLDPQFLPQFHPLGALIYCGLDASDSNKQTWAAC